MASKPTALAGVVAVVVVAVAEVEVAEVEVAEVEVAEVEVFGDVVGVVVGGRDDDVTGGRAWESVSWLRDQTV